MNSILLRANLSRPTPPPSTITRQRLLQHLNSGLNGKITLVSAPAGFGKSTIVSAWIDQIESQRPSENGAETPTIKASWLGLEEGDNLLPRFIRYFAAAIEIHFPGSCGAVTALLHDGHPPTIEELADLLASVLSQIEDRLLLVLDDLHLIDEPAIYAFLARLLQPPLPQFHLVLITRVDPPLPLNRWRARGQLNELRLRDLCFNLAETTAYLHKSLENPLADEIVATLHEHTEGWVVGLRLVTLALRGETDYSAIVAGFEANSNRYIVDYLIDDVLDQQPLAMQHFLISTSILTRFSPALCAAVVGIDEIAAQQHINQVARANLFLIELTTPARWYRYHHQFQSMLMSRLHERYDQQVIETLHRRAAIWLAAHDQLDEALRHLAIISDYVTATEMIETHRVAALNELRFQELEGWLALLPAHLVNQRPALLVSLAWVQDHRLEYTLCLATIERATALLDGQAETMSEVTLKLLRAELVAMRTSIGSPSMDEADALTQIWQTWLQIRPYLSYTHCLVVVWLSQTYHRRGGGENALEMLLTTFEQTTEWPQMARCRTLYSAGILYWYNCHLALAERTFHHGLHIARQHNLHVAATLCHFGLAVTASRYNQAELAEDYHLKVVKEPHFQNGLRAVLSAYSLIGIYSSRGQLDLARSVIQRLKSHATMMGRPYLLSQVAALEAYLALRSGELAVALRWALTGSRGPMYSSSDRIPLIHAHVLMAEGSNNSLYEATQILQDLSLHHETQRAWIFWLETIVPLAVAWVKLGEKVAALLALGRAVRLAAPNGLVDPFVDQGKPMERLLRELEKQAEYTQLVQLLLVAFPADIVEPTTPVHAQISVSGEELPEPLTEREIDVLFLLAGRLSNKEIAQKLIVSVHTVRNHTANIFSKLQVDNRLQAVVRARALGLLPQESLVAITDRSPVQ